MLTHCNAGWIATVDFGTALSAIYQAHDAVDPGARVGRRDAAAQPGAADGLGTRRARRAAHADRRQRGRPPDAARRGRPRAGRCGPRERAAATWRTRSAPTSRRSPRSTTACRSTPPCRRRRSTGRSTTALAGIPIEERAASEVREVAGLDAQQRRATVRIAGDDTPVGNPAFDVTPGPPGDRHHHRARRRRAGRTRLALSRAAARGMTELRDDSRELREAVIATARAMNASGINVNKSGNVSVRCRARARAGFLLTPTGVPVRPPRGRRHRVRRR